MIKIIYNEVYKLLARKKIYIFMAIILIVSLFSLASALITNGIFKPTNPNADTAMQSQILSSLGRFNGQSFPLTLFGGVMSTILPIFVVILIANMVTDEYTDGSLKLPLLRQVSRNELLIGKLVSLTVVMILMMLFLILLGYGLGTAFFGWGDRFLIKGRAISSSQGFIFTLLIYGSSLISLVSFGMVILLFAVLLDNSGSVVAIGMGILFSCWMNLMNAWICLKTTSIRRNIYKLCKRKEEYEIFKKLTPPRVITSDGEIFSGEYDAKNIPEGALAGVAVSSGIIEGRARVILNIEDRSKGIIALFIFKKFKELEN